MSLQDRDALHPLRSLDAGECQEALDGAQKHPPCNEGDCPAEAEALTPPNVGGVPQVDRRHTLGQPDNSHRAERYQVAAGEGDVAPLPVDIPEQTKAVHAGAIEGGHQKHETKEAQHAHQKGAVGNEYFVLGHTERIHVLPFQGLNALCVTKTL